MLWPRATAVFANTYYLGRLQAGDKGAADKALSKDVEVAWPDPVHVNITGAGVTASSKQPAEAQRFLGIPGLEPSAGAATPANHEYPIQGFGDDPVLAAWGTFQQADVSAAKLGELNRKALELMTANGWHDPCIASPLQTPGFPAATGPPRLLSGLAVLPAWPSPNSLIGM